MRHPEDVMDTHRLALFSDAVMAIILTIMVLELKVPHGTGIETLAPLLPVFFSYVLSFTYVAIYWVNHHHLLHRRPVNGAVLWANLHLLFWLSLLPFASGWMGQNHFAALPTALYGTVLFAAAMAWWILQLAFLRAEGPGSALRRIVRSDWKFRLSVSMYLAGIGASAVDARLSQFLFVAGAVWWLLPDRRLLPAMRPSRHQAGPDPGVDPPVGNPGPAARLPVGDVVDAERE
jgi:uncharacterized membrane protein